MVSALIGTSRATTSLVRRGLAPRPMLGADMHKALRLTMLFAALVITAAGVTLTLRANIGAGPGDVFLSALGSMTGIRHGSAALVFAAVMLTIALLLKARPGFGTFVGVVAFGPILNVMLATLGPIGDPVAAVVAFAVGFALITVGVALVIQSSLGSGSVELICAALHERFGFAAWKTRIVFEVTLAAIGIIAGGAFGVGTVAIAVLIGPAVALWTAVIGRVLHITTVHDGERRQLRLSRL